MWKLALLLSVYCSPCSQCKQRTSLFWKVNPTPFTNTKLPWNAILFQDVICALSSAMFIVSHWLQISCAHIRRDDLSSCHHQTQAGIWESSWGLSGLGMCDKCGNFANICMIPLRILVSVCALYCLLCTENTEQETWGVLSRSCWFLCKLCRENVWYLWCSAMFG